MFNFKTAESYCREPIIWIENAWEAASDTEHLWILRHKLESEHSPEELRKMKKWYSRPANELYFEREEESND